MSKLQNLFVCDDKLFWKEKIRNILILLSSFEENEKVIVGCLETLCKIVVFDISFKNIIHNFFCNNLFVSKMNVFCHSSNNYIKEMSCCLYAWYYGFESELNISFSFLSSLLLVLKNILLREASLEEKPDNHLIITMALAAYCSLLSSERTKSIINLNEYIPIIFNLIKFLFFALIFLFLCFIG
jgi:hypothetical protein